MGGRDLEDAVGGIMMSQAIRRLNKDPGTSVIVLVSKAPQGAAAANIYSLLAECNKPVVVNFLGTDVDEVKAAVPSNVTVAATLEDASIMAVMLQEGESSSAAADSVRARQSEGCPAMSHDGGDVPQGGSVRGLFTGGTLCKEATLVLKGENVAHKTIDLGDDEFTQGRAHPMIDPTLRNEYVAKCGEDPDVAVVLLDVVIGYGSHDDPAGAVLPHIEAARDSARRASRAPPVFVASVTGTEGDFQGLRAQQEALVKAGVHVLPSNAAASQVLVHKRN